MKNKNTAGILALFLGGLGIHKFYLDQPGTGLIYLFLSWTFIPAVLSFFEALWFFFISEDTFDNEYNMERAQEKIDKANIQLQQEYEEATMKDCPFCAERIKRQAIFCKHYKKDIS